MKALMTFNELFAAFASAALLSLSAFDAGAVAVAGAAEGTECDCYTGAGTGTVELLPPGCGISLITISMSSANSSSSSVPSHRSPHARLSKANTCSVTPPYFALPFNSLNYSMVNAPLCLSLSNSALMLSKAAAFIVKTLPPPPGWGIPPPESRMLSAVFFSGHTVFHDEPSVN